MTAKILDGKALSLKIRQTISDEIAEGIQQGFRAPGLAVILVGENEASQLYVDKKRQACLHVGIKSFYHHLPETTSKEELLHLIQDLNQDTSVDGILLQLPLPKHLDTEEMIEAISIKKDVDGFHPYNLGRLAARKPLLRPCTPLGVMTLLDSIQTEYKKKHAVIVGASNIVGRPMALELLIAGSTVTVCHRFTQNLEAYVSQADILVTAVGKPNLIKGGWIKESAIVIDIGINRLPDGNLQGDVEFDLASQKAAWITPVPGGVGPMTIVTLLRNTVSIWRSQRLKQF